MSVAAFGAYHGLNPAMGWLFALAVGLQDGRGRAIFRGMVPIALGHAASIAIVAGLVLALQTLVSLQALQLVTAALLIAFGVYKLFNWYRHPRWVGMRVRWHELAGWSFLMATAHGAGLMVAPALLGMLAVDHATHLTSGTNSLDVGLAVVLHTATMLLVMAVVAWIVHQKLGLMVLRRGWVNFDLIWAVALLAVGGVTFALAI